MTKFVGTTLPPQVYEKIKNTDFPDCLNEASKIRRLLVLGLEKADEK